MAAGKLAAGVAVLYYSCNSLRKCVYFLDQDEQLVVEGLTETTAQNGPGIRFVSPMVKSTEKRKGQLLEAVDFVRVKDNLNGEIRVETGPKLLFLGAYDEPIEEGQGYSLSPVEYCVVLDKISGKKRIEKGPKILMPGPYEDLGPQTAAISLEANQYCNLLDTATGKKWTQKGEHLLFLRANLANRRRCKDCHILEKDRVCPPRRQKYRQDSRRTRRADGLPNSIR